MIGETLAHYEIEDRLGEGGSGVVYRGRDLRLERRVAIKVLADALRDDELAWARLLREARMASQLNHPHIAAIYDLGEEDGRAYIAMEYVQGLPLADLIPEGGMPMELVGRYGAQISSALAFAHEQGVVHGDLKGSNIVVTADSNVKLLDFGLARRIPRDGMAEVTSSCLPLAEAGATAGTLPYLAPEILRGLSPSRQSDVWALGVLLYQMATGVLPFRGVTPFELCVEIMVGTPARLEEIPEPLRAFLRQSLEKDPGARVAPIGELEQALAPDSAHITAPQPEPVHATALTPAETPATPAPSHHRWVGWTAGAAALLGVALVGGIYFRHAPGPQPAAPPVVQAKQPPAPTAVRAENPAVKVWVNTGSGTYHCPGTRWYGKTHAGEFMTQKQARDKGYRPAANRACT